MNRKLPLVTLLTAMVWLTCQAAKPFVSFTKGDWQLNRDNRVTLCYDASDLKGVSHAVGNLQNDLKAVCGAEVSLTEAKDARILIGTVGHSRVIDNLVKQKVLNAQMLKGKREQYLVTTTPEGQLVIAGSDRRGTIFGIYELSQQLGVSPWYYWADVPIVRQEKVFILKGTYTDGEPRVRYRGLFLNDEAPCLTSWVKNTFGTNYGGHDFYEKVFELILRLKGNFLWPAMWGWAFYADDPENSRLADEMGIVMGTSHHEPMARNHQEWVRKRGQSGPWNYQVNQQVIDQFFREGMERAKTTEDLITIGMRGDGDEAMSEEADTKLLERIVKNQRKIIADVTGKPAKQTPQVWALYKEVLDYYDKGMRVPDDVTILLCDDNWGNVRRVPNAEERKHPGGWGLYYHVDYVGAPRNTKWLNVTQTQQMHEQLSLAYDNGIDRLWVLNVGDLKPMEYPIQLFMDMAWQPKTYTTANVKQHTLQFFNTFLCQKLAQESTDIYNRNCQYMARVTPEMLDANTYNIETGEWQQVADAYARLERDALRLFSEIPAEAHDAYRQLILFPVQAMANLYDLYFAVAKNRQMAKRGLPEANAWAAKAERCFLRDSLLCAAYNHEIAGGKWNGMMTQKHIGYTIWNDNFPKDHLPAMQHVEAQEPGGYRFEPSVGYVSMEAEHFFSSEAPEGTQWTVYPDFGRTLSAMALTPVTKPADGASLSYRFSLPESQPAKVTVHVIVKSTLDYLNVGGLEYTVSLDDSEPVTVNFNKNLVDRQPFVYSVFYPTIARRVVEKKVELPLNTKETEHTLTLRPCHPGIVFEKVVVDFGGYKPSYLFMDESPVRK